MEQPVNDCASAGWLAEGLWAADIVRHQSRIKILADLLGGGKPAGKSHASTGEETETATDAEHIKGKYQVRQKTNHRPSSPISIRNSHYRPPHITHTTHTTLAK